MKFSSHAFLKLALALSSIASVALVGCGKKDEDKKDSAGPGAINPTPSPGAMNLYENACSLASDQYVCSHKGVSDYFETTGANPFESNMDVFTFSAPDRSASATGGAVTSNTWIVTDSAGTDLTSVGIKLTQGKPVKFILKGQASNDQNTKAHYLGDPYLLFNSGLFKFESKGHFSVIGPYVNAIENRTSSSDVGATKDFELAIYFVPMVRGTYSTYCQQSVNIGADYKLIRSGAISPDLASGHASTGMKLTVTVEGDKNVIMSAPHSTVAEANQRSAFDNHVWGDNSSIIEVNGPNHASTTKPSGAHLWNTTITTAASSTTPGTLSVPASNKLFDYSNNSTCTGYGPVAVQPHKTSGNQYSLASITLSGYCKFLVGNNGSFTQYTNAANMGSASAVSADAPLLLRTGHAHIIRFKNDGTDDMTLDVEKLTRSFVIRKFQNVNGEFKVDFAKSITVKSGKWMEMWAVPMVVGDFTLDTGTGAAAKIKVVAEAI